MEEEIQFVNIDAEALYIEAMRAMQEELGETLAPADERRMFFSMLMRFVIGTYTLINDTGMQNLLRYARGETMDAIGERSDTTRIPASPASVTLQFTLSAAQDTLPVVIPAGTRVTPDNRVYFATTEAISIQPGMMTGEVTARSLIEEGQSGADHNGFLPGSIVAIVDPVPFVQSVRNTTESAGGRDEEEDDSYRVRIRLAPTRYSNAGSSGAYVYYSRGASVDVTDASAVQSGPGEVLVSLILDEMAEDPSQVIEAVYEAINDRKIRPLTDLVTVQEATTQTYGINFTYWTPKATESQVIEAIEGENGALAQYIAWQDYTMGKDINPDKLRALILAAGAVRVTVNQPAYTTLELTQRARVSGTPTVTHEVLIDETPTY